MSGVAGCSTTVAAQNQLGTPELGRASMLPGVAGCSTAVAAQNQLGPHELGPHVDNVRGRRLQHRGGCSSLVHALPARGGQALQCTGTPTLSPELL